jgi:hypothetical protein
MQESKKSTNGSRSIILDVVFYINKSGVGFYKGQTLRKFIL